MVLKVNKRTTFNIAVSLLTAFYLASLPVDIFVDRENYLRFAELIYYFTSYRLGSGISVFMSNEPVFAVVNLILRQFFNAFDTVRIIIFCSTFTSFYLVLTHIPKRYLFFAALVLLLPQVLKNYIVHLRQGFALSLFLLGWFSTNKKKRLILFLLAALTHSSFLIILSGLLVVYLSKKLKLPDLLRYLLYTLSGLFIGLYGLIVAESLGARQGDTYKDFDFDGGLGLGFIFWLLVLIIYISQGGQFTKKHTSSIFFLCLYLSTYFFLPVTARIFESALIIILLSATDLSKYRRLVFYCIYGSYFIISWILRFPRPGFGWIQIN